VTLDDRGSDLAAAGRWRPPPAAVHHSKLVLVLGLWSSGLVAMFVAPELLVVTRDAAFLLLLALALPAAKTVSRGVAGSGLAAAAMLALFYGETGALFAAAEGALVFVIFLPALFLMRETVQRSPEARTAEAAFDQLGPGRRIAGLTVGSHLLAAVMIIGALPVIRPFLVRQEPGLRAEFARASIRGFALCVLWSPFTVAMGFVLTARPEVELAAVIAVGLPTTAAALVGAVFVDRGLKGVRAALPALVAFKSLAVPIVVMVGLVVLMASVSPLSTLEVVAIVLPPLCLARLWALPARPVGDALVAAGRDLPRMGDELLIFTGALLLGDLITTTGVADLVAAALHLERWPLPLVPLLGFALGPPLALAGLHPIVAATVLFALLEPVGDQLPDLVEIQIVLFGWMAGAMVSYASLSIVAASSLFEVPVGRLVLGVNLRYLLGLALAVAGVHGFVLAGLG
jgi:hypothetical protein